MKYATPEAFRVALEQRLLARSREGAFSLPRLRKAVVFDRYLARLLVVAPDRWLIKGGVALDLRYGAKARMTKDMDLGHQQAEEDATADLMAAAALGLGDFFRFTARRTTKLDNLQDGVAVRYQISSVLAGRRFEDVQVDVGLRSSIAVGSDRVPGTDLLTFADIERIEIPALPLAFHVAEKLHAYTQTFHDQRRNTRAKDLVDLILIRSTAAFAAIQLRDAIQTGFSGRDSQPIPTALPLPPAIWEERYRALAADVGLDPDVTTGYRLAAAFLDPVLDGSVTDRAIWDPSLGSWTLPT
jgi:hypothetical protein